MGHSVAVPLRTKPPLGTCLSTVLQDPHVLDVGGPIHGASLVPHNAACGTLPPRWHEPTRCATVHAQSSPTQAGAWRRYAMAGSPTQLHAPHRQQVCDPAAFSTPQLRL